jgi:exosortase
LSSTPRSETSRWILFFFWVFACLGLFWKPLANLGHLGLHDQNVSHIFLIPFISVWLMIIDRKETPPQPKTDRAAALVFLLPTLILATWTLSSASLNPSERLSGSILSLILLSVTGFVFLFGRETALASSFPLAFLLFAVPLPNFVLNRLIYWLQAGSAAVAEFFFDLSGFPVLREGFVFRLPRINIEVAKECSGIRSSIALLILAVLVAHFAFQAMWKKLIFIVAGLVMMLVKNGVRIATLTILANYVDPDFLYGRLHHDGGVVFFLVGLGLMLPIYWFLKKGEPNDSGARMAGPEPAKP